MNQESTLSLNNQTGFYQFYSTANIIRTKMVAKVNVTINFNSGKTIDTDNQTTLGGFYLSRKNNENTIESLYPFGGTSLPVATAMLNDILYTQIFECTTQHLESNCIRSTIGPIQDLGNEQNPVLCLYTTYAHYNVAMAMPMKTA